MAGALADMFLQSHFMRVTSARHKTGILRSRDATKIAKSFANEMQLAVEVSNGGQWCRHNTSS
jgi:hypothetical protein